VTRIEPVTPDKADADIRPLLSSGPQRAGVNLTRTLANHPRIFKRWTRYESYLTKGLIPAQDRELLILRAAFRSTSRYDWERHKNAALESGLTNDTVSAAVKPPRVGPDATFDDVLLRAADELLDQHRLSDELWGALTERFSDEQLIELTMVVGVFYAMGVTSNALGVQTEAEGVSA